MQAMKTGRSTILGLSILLAACDNQPTAAPEIATESIQIGQPVSQTMPHAFVGMTLNIVLLSTDAVTQCLDAIGAGDPNDRIQVFPCHDGPNQRWKVEAAPLSTGSLEGHDLRIIRKRQDLVMFRSMVNPALCLDVWDATANGGEDIQVFYCHGGANQAFELPRKMANSSSPTTGAIKTEISGFTMAFDAGTATDHKVRQRIANQTARQHWGFQIAGTGFRL